MNNPSLVLTATIDVTVNKTVKIKNSNERLEQYIKSLKKWLTKQNIFKRIVFVENSGHNLNELRELVINIKHNKQVEFVSFVSEENKNSTDTGFGELGEIKYVLDNSKLVGRYFFKCTGRSFVKNINNIKFNNYDIQCNFRNNLVYTDSIFFGMKTEIFVNHIYPIMLKNANKGRHFEQGLAMGIHNSLLHGAKWSPIFPMPYHDGVSGAKGYHYMRQFPIHRRLLKNIVDHLCFKFSYTSYKDGRHYYDVTK